MKKIKFDAFQQTPIPGKDAYLLEWAIKDENNKLKIIKSVVIDGMDLTMETYCLDCLRKCGEKTKLVKYCPVCKKVVDYG